MALDSSERATPVSVMIFTLDEEIHLPSCLASVSWSDDVIVIDSFSKDRTEEICRAAGARFFQHEFEGFGKQRTWALGNATPKHDWVLILDADERVSPELAHEIAVTIPCAADDIAAYRVKRRFFIWGRWLKYSALYPTWVVRLIRKGRVRYVNRGHAETQEVSGAVRELHGHLVDENLKGIDEWFQRQNRYSTKEADFEIQQKSRAIDVKALLSGDPLERRSAIKRIAARLPFRPLLYFVYAYLLRGGFLEGKDGLIFCIMKSEYLRMIAVKKHDRQRKSSR